MTSSLRTLFLIFLLGLFILSCKGKENPTIAPPPPISLPNNNKEYSDNNANNRDNRDNSETDINDTRGSKDVSEGGIFTLETGETQFKIELLKGENLTIEGVGAESGTIEEITVRSESPKIFTASQGYVIIRGKLSQLIISDGRFNKIDLSKANTLNYLGLKRVTTNTLNLSSIYALRSLSLSETHIDKTPNNWIDLTAHKNLEYLNLNNSTGVIWPPRSVKILTVVRAHKIISGFLNYLSLPNLETLRIMECNFEGIEGNLDFQDLPKLKTVLIDNCRGAYYLSFYDCKSLKNVLLRNLIEAETISFGGCANLNDGKVINLNNFTGLTATGKIVSPHTLWLYNTALTKFDHNTFPTTSIRKLSLRKTPITSADFSQFQMLNSLDLTETTSLTGDRLKKALLSLPNTKDGALTAKHLSEEDKTILRRKGWTVIPPLFK